MRLFHIKAAVLAALCLSALACASGPQPIPANITAPELIQRAQEASDKNNYNQAIACYQAILDRFPEDLSNVCAAEYEIAFIQYKQKHYAEAKAGFQKLLERYNGSDSVLLPEHFKILAEKILAKILTAAK